MKIILSLVSLILFYGFVPRDRVSFLGRWRGEFEIRPGIKVPFNFELAEKKDQSASIFFLNGDERFDGGTVKQVKDSLFVALDQFDNEFAFKISGNELAGVLRKQGGIGNKTPVKTFRIGLRKQLLLVLLISPGPMILLLSRTMEKKKKQ